MAAAISCILAVPGAALRILARSAKAIVSANKDTANTKYTRFKLASAKLTGFPEDTSCFNFHSYVFVYR
jgi:hypothetical protein